MTTSGSKRLSLGHTSRLRTPTSKQSRPSWSPFEVGDYWWTTNLEGLGVESSYYHGVDISASLPRGCGYSLGTEGGDPERDDINLETLGKASGSAAPWNH
jgi:hypothetical protein